MPVGALHEVVRELGLAAADVEHTLARVDVVYEEVVVRHQAVLDVDAAVVRDRRVVDAPVEVVVRADELAQRRRRLALRHAERPRAQREACGRSGDDTGDGPEAAPDRGPERHRASSSNTFRCRSSHSARPKRATARARAAAR